MNDELPVYLMSPPRHDWTLRGKANFRSNSAAPVVPEVARAEWAALADAICEAGGEVVVVPPSPKKNLTGMIYTAEAGEYYPCDDGPSPGCFLLPNMAVEHRRDEADWIGGFMSGLGLEVEAIHATWEAQGDAIRADGGRKVIHTFGSGNYARTKSHAYEEVAHLLGEAHIQIHFRADPWFHGNTFMNVYHGREMPKRLAEDGPRQPHILLVCKEALLPGEFDRLERFVPEADVVGITREESLGYDTNALQVHETIIATSDLSETARDAFSRLGLDVVELHLAELFAKGGGAPVCLTNRMWGLDVDDLPDHVLWSTHASIEAHTSG